MNKLFNTFFLISVVFLVSCSAKDDDAIIQQPPVVTKCQPIITKMRLNGDTAVYSSTRHTYDAAGRMIEIAYHQQFSTDVLKIIYDQQGRISEITDGFNNIAEKRTYSQAGQLVKIVYYDGQNPNGTAKQHHENIFVYDAANRLKQMWHTPIYQPATGQQHIEFYHSYTYNQAGLIAVDSFYYKSNGKFVPGLKDDYTYDTKVGVNEFGYSIAAFTDDYLYRFAPVKHNVISASGFRGGSNYKRTTQYQYNQHGYPVKEISSSNTGPASTVIDITYNCF